uniref:Ion transport domain-containing protein n=3 Tax=Trichobilharzia regenti TaxID=157069 RepID=A0AA85JLR9_TRIRE|nr:unnamed protein product [Trichobilharzia regenti]
MLSFHSSKSYVLENFIQKQARVLIEDAENYRSIQHKLDKRSLRMYDLSHSLWVNVVYRTSLVVMFLLPFFEWPSSLTKSSDVRLRLKLPNPPCGLTEAIELMCLVVLVVQSLMLSGAFGRSWVRSNPWLIGKYILFVVYLLDLLVSLSLRCSEFYRIRRLIRPYFLISGSQLMKKVIKCFKRTLPTLFSLLFLLIFWLASATLVAMCVFSKPKHDLTTGVSVTNVTSSSFADFYSTMFNLLVLLTTANHPDVLIPSYNINRGTAIFSVVFLSVGLYVFLNILTAAVYSEFSGYLLSSVQTRLMRRRVATRAAFEVLKSNYNGREMVCTTDIIHLIDSVHIDAWKKRELRQVYMVRFDQCDLDAKQFMQLFQTLDLLGPPNYHSFQQLPANRFAQLFQKWIISRGFEVVSIGVSVLNVIFLCVDISYSLSTGAYPGIAMRTISWCFVIFYSFEQCSLLWAYGCKSFFSKKSNIFGFSIVVILLIAKLLELGLLLASLSGNHFLHFTMTIWDVVRLTNILLLSRAARLMNLFKWSRLVVSVLADLPRNLSPVLGILMSAFYFYALLGMNLFYNVIKYDNSTNISKAEKTYECGTYQEMEYWSVNFNDFAASLVLLWDLMVVNNWHVIVTAYQKAVNRWVHVYMISWWLIVVVGILSLTTAFIIETFLYRRDLYTEILNYQNQPTETLRNETLNSNEQMYSCMNQHSYSNNTGESSRQKSRRLVVASMSFLRRRSSTEITPMSLDEIFRRKLQEPSEESILSEINSHPYFREVMV